MLPDAMLDAMKTKIDNAVGGFRTFEAQKAYYRVGLYLLDGGHGEEDITRMLADLYRASAGEYDR